MNKNEEKLNILIVHNYYQIPGGEDTVVANEKKLLEKHNHKVILYTRSNAELKTMSKFRKMCLPFTTIFNPKTYRDIKEIIKNKQIDVVHVHNTLNLLSPSVYYAAKRCKIPVVQTIHNFRLLCPGATFYRDGHICEDCVKKGLGCAVKHRCYRGSKIQTLSCVISTCFHRFTGIYKKINYICLTEFNKEKLLLLKQIVSDRVYVKPNFIDSQKDIIPSEDRYDQYVFAGRLDKLKGIDFLLNAWKSMGDSAPKLIVCGTGPMEDWCKKYINDNNINCEMKGFLPNEETLDVIARSKALILPTQWYEGFPMSIVEAYSVGTPVICSDIGNAAAVVEEGVTGWKYLFNDTEELIKTIKKWSNIYKSVKTVYEKKYTSDDNYLKIIEIYKSIQ